jgi:hypothetical protein
MEVDDVSVVLDHREGRDGVLRALERVDSGLEFDANGFDLRLQAQYLMFGSGEAGLENGVCVSELVCSSGVGFKRPRFLDKVFEVGFGFL